MARRLSLICGIVLGGLVSFGTSAAAAAPIWNLDIHHLETNFSPGEHGEYWFDVVNVGDSDAHAPITVTIELPPGLTREFVGAGFEFFAGPNINWSCPGSPGDSTIVCTSDETIPRHTGVRNLYVSVDIAPESSGSGVVTANVEGGGAAVAGSAVELTPISSEPASFGVVNGSWLGDFYERDGLSTVREAGSHPDLATFAFDLNTIDDSLFDPRGKLPVGFMRNVRIVLPPGFVGNPTAVDECRAVELFTFSCPPASQVGRFEGEIVAPEASHYWALTLPVYNMIHPRGVAADFAFAPFGTAVHIRASLDPADAYAITADIPNINETIPFYHQKTTIWGVPGDPFHDAERCVSQGIIQTSEECSLDRPEKPLLTVPSRCDLNQVMRLTEYDSWQEPGVFRPEVDYMLPGKGTHCERPRFEPSVRVTPTGGQAASPTGLEVTIGVAQNENPNGLATPPSKRIRVSLPPGMTFSPSFADGLKACSLAQMRLGTNQAIECPDASRIGEATLQTPILPKAVEGSMYLAAQGDNPFGSIFAVYLVLHDTEERGILVKLPGRIDVDPTSGQIVTTFNETPQFPLSGLTLKFRSGPRAPLISPPSCGRQAIGVEVTSYAQPQNPVDTSNTYEVSEGPGGSECPPAAAQRPFAPKFSAGTLNPVAGSYSPFLFRLSRADREQDLSRVVTVLPPGLVAKIAGVPFCPDSLIASISSEVGTGTEELSHPSCPAASQVGTLSVGLGAGPGPSYFPGRAYLAGPYKGAPLSLAIVVPGLAGPFDLGSVVTRAALYVDPRQARIKAVSDPFPPILHGVVLRVRDVRFRIDRPSTTLNPTSCDRMSVDGEIDGAGGSQFTTADDFPFFVSSPFQVGSCASLRFEPKLALRLFGGTHRGAHPKLRATLKMRPGSANIASASVVLPRSEFLDQANIKAVCTKAQFAGDACPPTSIYGTVRARSPLLDETLAGNVYLRTSKHSLPDLVATLKGKIDVDLVGRIDSLHGGIRTTFNSTPDAPVDSFTLTLAGGSKGLLVNSEDLCGRRRRATAKLAAHNGDRVTLRPVLRSACDRAGSGGRPGGNRG